eukprot:2342995-Karenia_brevis.AAC.1
MHADQHKDSNMEATAISKTLDLVFNKVAAGNPTAVLPRSLVIAADNTTREAENQHFLTYMALLKAQGKFDSAD